MREHEDKAEAGDVVQLDPDHCRWGAAFVIVTEVRSWGVIGYMLIPGQDGIAPIRANHEHYARIGVARWVMERGRDDA